MLKNKQVVATSWDWDNPSMVSIEKKKNKTKSKKIWKSPHPNSVQGIQSFKLSPSNFLPGLVQIIQIICSANYTMTIRTMIKFEDENGKFFFTILYNLQLYLHFHGSQYATYIIG